MWIVLRLLTAVAVGLAKYFWRHRREGERQESGTTPWYLQQGKHKGRVVSTSFGVGFHHPIYFRFSREGGVDRFFKTIGFTHEVQTGDAAFDRAVYVSCDHPAMAPVLQESAETRRAVLELFAGNTSAIYADGARLWVNRKGDSPPSERDLERLALLRDALQAVPAEHLPALRDPFFWRALVVESIAWSVAAYCLPAIVEIVARSEPRYFDWTPVVMAGLALAVVVFALLFAFSRWLLRGSSRAHRVLTESAIVLALGVPFSSIEVVSDVNIALDRSAPSIVEAAVSDKYIRTSRGRRGRRRTHHHLRLAPSAQQPGIPRDLQVSASLYHATSRGGRLAIALRAGAVGIPWVESVRPAP